ncbi:MAG: cell division protein SepF [Desulfotomaculum sp. BICA1-6]|nr:MAG: cell division protein SepF [Peptococcaceae bacterium BRH_c8a]KJS77994.1 MAG: cell division protein SepF [Desulfotomaculum sp. BICA1-6]
MPKLMDKMLNFMGFEDEPLDVDNERDDALGEEDRSQQSKSRKSRGQVVSLHAQRQVRVVVMEPTSFDSVQAIADNLKNRRPVIINLEHAEPDLAKRVVDFVMGATYALNGSIQKVGKGIFLSVPSNIEIDGDLGEQLSEKGIFAWLKP